MTLTWNAQTAAHLHRRAGFGATRKQVDKAVKAGFEQTLKKLLKQDKSKFLPPKAIDSLESLQSWWFRRLVMSKKPLTEKLALFWHNHFATAYSKVGRVDYMALHVATLRLYGMGRFHDLVLAMSRDPAMLIWLDNRTNYVGNINENYSRELQELFTTGVHDKDGQPNFTELDVQEVARAFTGWSLKDGAFKFKTDKHDFGTKTIKGVTGQLDGTDVVAILAGDPATARRIPQKLWSYFAYPIELTDPLCDELQAVYQSSDGHIGTVVEFIFRHELFFSEAAQRAVVKGPAEFFAGSLRLLQGKVHSGYPGELGTVLAELGQSLFNPPSVFGWKEGLKWVETSGLLARNTRGEWIADARDKDHPVQYAPKKLLGKKSEWATLDAAQVVARVLLALDAEVSPATATALEAYVAADENGQPQPIVVDDDFVDLKVRGLVSLILGSPEYQLA